MPDEIDDTIVIRGLRDGRRDAWDALYAGYQVRVWQRVARLIGGNAAAVADVVQETFMAAARSAGQFDETRGTLWSWLAGIAQHQTRLYWRHEQRAGRVKQLAAVGLVDCFSSSADASSPDLLQQQEVAEAVRRILAEMPAEDAALLSAKYLDDQSVAEICRDCGRSAEAVRSKLARARVEFRARFT